MFRLFRSDNGEAASRDTVESQLMVKNTFFEVQGVDTIPSSSVRPGTFPLTEPSYVRRISPTDEDCDFTTASEDACAEESASSSDPEYVSTFGSDGVAVRVGEEYKTFDPDDLPEPAVVVPLPPPGLRCMMPFDVPCQSPAVAPSSKVKITIEPAAGQVKQSAEQKPKQKRKGASKTVKGDTTMMLRNIPLNYSRRMFVAMLEAEGFFGKFDFVYLPIDFNTRASLGYAFLNATTPEDAVAMKAHFTEFTRWSLPSSKVCQVVWSRPYQGLSEHINRFRNSPVMHASVPDEFKPMTFKNGMRSTFPAPTRPIEAPKVRE